MALSKKLVTPASRREAASYVVQQHAMSERRACRLVGVARSTKWYQKRGRREKLEWRQQMRGLALERPTLALLAQDEWKMRRHSP
jgi:putative transposase